MAATITTNQGVVGVTLDGDKAPCTTNALVSLASQKYFDAGVHEIRLVFNEPNKDAYLKALRAVAPRA